MSQQGKLRFIAIHLVSPFTSHYEAEIELEELKSLINTYGGATIEHIIQRKMRPDPGTYIGKGKLGEVATLVKELKIDGIVLNAIVNPSQLFNIKKALWDINPLIEVWDRIDLILHIFDKHAHTAEAKLQIESARMRHMGPRIYGLGGTVLSRQGAGIGTRGLGETNIELMKRHWRQEMRQINERLTKIASQRESQLQRRKDLGLQTVSIIGYTNAGKSSLYNLFTHKDKLTKDVLFATLDSNVGKIYLQKSKRNVLISDTIGFIQNLPPSLISAFRSTLMESIHADLLLHVIDASDMLMREKITVVEETLEDLGMNNKKEIYVFNKIDKAENLNKEDLTEIYSQYSPQFISVKDKIGIAELLQIIETEIDIIKSQ